MTTLISIRITRNLKIIENITRMNPSEFGVKPDEHCCFVCLFSNKIDLSFVNQWFIDSDIDTPLNITEKNYQNLNIRPISNNEYNIDDNMNLINVAFEDEKILAPYAAYISNNAYMIIYEQDIVVFVEPNGDKFLSRIS